MVATTTGPSDPDDPVPHAAASNHQTASNPTVPRLDNAAIMRIIIGSVYPAVDTQIERTLYDQDVRYTEGRRQVVAALSAADGPRSAGELVAELAAPLPLSSIYRTLAVLAAAGVVVPHYSTKGLTRYELAEWLTGHHHHLVCAECGTVEDVEIPDAFERELRALVSGIGEHAGFSPTSHALEIEGRCEGCS